MPRKMIVAERDLNCSECAWSLPLPSVNQSVAIVMAEGPYNTHGCSDYHKKKGREDFSQAAVRIVREATED